MSNARDEVIVTTYLAEPPPPKKPKPIPEPKYDKYNGYEPLSHIQIKQQQRIRAGSVFKVPKNVEDRKPPIKIKKNQIIEASETEIIKQLCSMAFTNVTDVMEWDARGKVTVLASDEIKPAAIPAIKKVKATTKLFYDQQGRVTGRIDDLTLEMADKQAALAKLGESIALWKRNAKGTKPEFNEYIKHIQELLGTITPE